MKNSILSKLSIFIPGILLLCLWEFIVYKNEELLFLFSSPSKVFLTLASEVVTKDLWINVGVTFQEALLGLLIGTFLGTLFGLMMWGSKSIEKISKPYVAIISSIPIFAIAPMLIIWFGTGLLSKVIMSAFAVFLIALTQSYEGAKIAAKKYMFFANTIAAKNTDIVRKIIIPASMQWVLVGFKMNIGFAILGAFIAEFISSKAGLGYYILKASSLFDVSKVIVGILMITFLALIMNKMVELLEKKFMPWSKK